MQIRSHRRRPALTPVTPIEPVTSEGMGGWDVDGEEIHYEHHAGGSCHHATWRANCHMVRSRLPTGVLIPVV
jgi:hypothetical protein